MLELLPVLAFSAWVTAQLVAMVFCRCIYQEYARDIGSIVDPPNPSHWSKDGTARPDGTQAQSACAALISLIPNPEGLGSPSSILPRGKS
jgi:hypothetical protein